MQILSSTDRKIKTIFHIADIHVRTGDERVEEYGRVMESLIAELSSSEDVRDRRALLLIAGDLFHHKGRIDSTGGKLMFDFINGLLEIIPVFIICGNHDMRQEDMECTDMISFLVSPYSSKIDARELYYLSETGVYVYDNVAFGVVSVKDTLRANNTFGIRDHLPDFPDPDTIRDANIDTKVAVFHGSLSGTTLSSGRKHNPLGQRYELSWFRGYDIAMLGDNHKQQITNASPPEISWGYPGSLVQQDYGESLSGHGYIRWDLPTRSGTPVDIRNEFGRITLKIAPSPQRISLVPSVFTSLDEVPMSSIPKRARVRVISTGRESPHEISDALKKIGVPHPTEIVYTAAHHALENGALFGDSRIESSSCDLEENREQRDAWESYVRDNGCDPGTFISDPESAFVVPCEDSLSADRNSSSAERNSSSADRNKKIRDMASKFVEMMDRATTKRDRVVFTRMRWKNLFCYGDHESEFNFEAAQGSIVQIYGRNGTGKSAFMDVLCIGLFGQPLDQEFAKVVEAEKIMYDGSESAEVSVTMRIKKDGSFRDYVVSRKFVMKRGQMKQTADVKDHMEVVAEGITMVSRWVNDTIGAVDDLQMSSFLAQNDLSSFFFKKPSDQKSMLEKAFHLDNVTFFESIIDESLNAHAFVLREATTTRDALEADVKSLVDLMGSPSSDSTSDSEEIERIKERVKSLYEERDVHLKTLAISDHGDCIDADKASEDVWMRIVESEGIRDSEPVSFASLEQSRKKLFAMKTKIDAIKKSLGNVSIDVERIDEDELEKKRGRLEGLGIRRPLHVTNVFIAHSDKTLEKFEEREREISALSEAKPIPRRPISQLDAHRARLSRWKTLEDAVGTRCRKETRDRLEAFKKKQEIAHRIEKLDLELSKNLKFKVQLNPDCHVCRQNPTFTRCEEIQLEISSLSETHKDVLGLEGAGEISSLQRELAEIDEYASKKEDMDEEIREWTLAEGEFERADAIEDAMKAKVEYQWIAYVEEMSRLSSALRQFRDTKSLRDLSDSYEDAERSYSKDSEMRKAWAGAHRYRRSVATSELSRITSEIAANEARSSDLSRRAAIATIVESKALTLSRAVSFASTIMDRTQTLKAFRQAFSGLRTHLYTTKVVPEVERHINNFVELFSDFKVCVSEIAGKKGVNIAFHIDDRGCRPPLERASGYQKFVVNLAMRISLSRIGSIGQNVGHLFLDEGFVACDAANLKKSTNLLREIMARGGYESIFIMTHLEVLEDAADHRATIVRSADNKSSRLVWPA